MGYQAIAHTDDTCEWSTFSQEVTVVSPQTFSRITKLESVERSKTSSETKNELMMNFTNMCKHQLML